jgi:hypothetical protein
MNFTQQLTDYIRAGFAGLWVQTSEPDEAHREIADLCAQQTPTAEDPGAWIFQAWDIAQGIYGTPNTGANDPLFPIKFALDRPDTPQTVVMVLHHYHWFLKRPDIIQTLFNAVIHGKATRVIFLVLAPTVEIPRELEHLFTVLEHQLPDIPALGAIAADLTQDDPNAMAGPDALRAAAGLTHYEAEGSFALSLARHNAIQTDTIWELKTQAIKKSGVLTLHRGGETFSQLGGLDALKKFSRAALPRERRPLLAKGLLLLGVPGTGKSFFAKALGAETGRPVLILDIGSLMGSLVGQTEANLRNALRIADAMAPCVLMIDEVEKALAGATSQHQGDSGVAARTLGTLLTWLNDHDTDVFVICTSNNVQALPPEFSRAERFDGVFFLDLPDIDQRAAIWQLYMKHYGHQFSSPYANHPGVPDNQWTGAEIKACCRLAALLNLPLEQAAENIVPVALTAAQQVTALREWATGRCLDASRGGIYHHQPTNGTPSKRRQLART